MHAKKIIDFLVDNSIEFDLPGIAGSSTRFETPMDACKAALESEQIVSRQFQAMAVAATEEHDFRAFQFLQWFINEQVEEESKMQKLIAIFSPVASIPSKRSRSWTSTTRIEARIAELLAADRV